MLNKEQTIASEINHERVLVLAGPGTGKTTTLISRYKYLIKNGIKPDEIICCTFSRKAADEIKKRLNKTLGNVLIMFILNGFFLKFQAPQN